MDEKTGLIVWFVGLIMPTGDTPAKLHAWAKRFAIVFLVFLAVSAFLLLAAADFIPGVDGFARQSEVATIQTKLAMADVRLDGKLSNVNSALNFIQKQSIEQSIISKIRVRCSTQDTQFRATLSEQIQHLEDRYYELPGATQPFQQPTCFEVGVGQ